MLIFLDEQFGNRCFLPWDLVLKRSRSVNDHAPKHRLKPFGYRTSPPGINVAVARFEVPTAWDSNEFLLSSEPPWEQSRPMWQDDRDAIVQSLYKEFWDAKEALAVLQSSLIDITATSSITTEEGYLMYSLSGLRLLDTDYVREQVAQYQAAREHKNALRTRLMELGQPDPE